MASPAVYLVMSKPKLIIANYGGTEIAASPLKDVGSDLELNF